MSRAAALFLALALVPGLAGPAAAEERLSAEEFEALSEGHTLRFDQRDLPFGAEQFFEGRRTLWRPLGGECVEGVWYERDGAICFLYEEQGSEQCWHLLRREGEIYARSIDDVSGAAELRMSERSTRPLDCPGPSLGA